MKVLVTGGAGYIGSVTAELLVREGHQVTVLDSLVHGHRAAVPREADFLKCDLSDFSAIHALVQSSQPDAIMHFAGHTQVGESIRHPFRYLSDNVVAGLNLMRASVELGVRRFILSSTANLFDLPDRIPIDESTSPKPGSPYGEGKLYLERILSWLDRTHQVRSASLRYFNAAGATLDRGEDHRPETHLIPIVLQAAQGHREKITIFGADWDTPDGTCVRDYIHVSDLATAHILALKSLEGGSRIYNLGNGIGHSVRDVIRIAERVSKSQIKVETAPRRDGDVARLVADSTRIRKELGWSPSFGDLESIVASAWRWMQNHPHGYADRDS